MRAIILAAFLSAAGDQAEHQARLCQHAISIRDFAREDLSAAIASYRSCLEGPSGAGCSSAFARLVDARAHAAAMMDEAEEACVLTDTIPADVPRP